MHTRRHTTHTHTNTHFHALTQCYRVNAYIQKHTLIILSITYTHVDTLSSHAYCREQDDSRRDERVNDGREATSRIDNEAGTWRIHHVYLQMDADEI